ncbi:MULTISPECIES: lonely Cys domain-containing protein, partial [unclassified Streptomyces]|uniref:lonely Cys domain-containing protein n=1 Tax=unclassified Streptomyces TaxID=2593676 RepID=UPI00114CDD3C
MTSGPSAPVRPNAGQTPAPIVSAPADPVADLSANTPAGPASPAGPSPAAAPEALLPPLSLLTFDEDSEHLTDEQTGEISALARQTAEVGMRDIRAGLPAPRITITVTSAENGSGQPPGTAGEHPVRTVAEAFRVELARQLAAVQNDVDAGLVTSGGEDDIGVDAFPITVQDRGHGLPADRGPAGADTPAHRPRAAIGIARSPHSVAVERLDALRAADPDPGLRTIASDALVRRILHRTPDSTVGAAERTELYTLVDAAMADGRAKSLAQLGAHHLKQQGALSAATPVTAIGGARVGINFTAVPVSDMVTSKYDLVRGGRRRRQLPLYQPRPGSPRPYLVLADGSHEEVQVPWSDGSRHAVPPEEFAELLAMVPGLAALADGIPLVLMVPRAGAEGLRLPRAVATATDRTVWAHSGTAWVDRSPETMQNRIAVFDGWPTGKTPAGSWIASRPGYQAHGTRGWIRTVDNRTVSDDEISSMTIASAGQPIGRAMFDDDDMVLREVFFEGLPDHQESFSIDPVANTALAGPQPLPWAGQKPYYLYLHGLPGRLSLRSKAGAPVSASGDQVGGYLQRRPSVQRLDADQPIVLMSCWADTPADEAALTTYYGNYAGRPPFIADPLDIISAAQSVANATRHTVFAPDRIHAFHSQKQAVMATALNESGVWRELRPEPLDDALDELAGVAGLVPTPGPAGAQTRETTLRLVRALRQTFGPAVEDDKDDPAGAYQELLRGIGALESMRANDQGLDRAGQFTLDLLDRAARSHLGRAGTDKPWPAPLERADVRAVLLAAGTRLDGAAGTALRDFAPLPSLDQALHLLDEGDQDQRAIDVLGLNANSWVSGDDWQRVVWATVKAVESAHHSGPDWQAAAQRMLHLDARPDAADEARRAELLWTVAGAAAAGRDPGNPNAVAAHHLELNGALSEKTLILSPSGWEMGRNWTGRPITGTMVTDSYVVSPDGSLGHGTAQSAPWNRTETKPGVLPTAYFVVAEGQHTDAVDMPWPDGTRRRVPSAEIAELLANTADLLPLAAHEVPIVLVGVSNVGMAKEIAAREAAARTVQVPAGPTKLVHDPQSGRDFLVLTGDPASSTPLSDWASVVPPVPDGPQPPGTPQTPPASASAPAVSVVTSGDVTTEDGTGSAPAPRSLSSGAGPSRPVAEPSAEPAAPVVTSPAAPLITGNAAGTVADPVTQDPAPQPLTHAAPPGAAGPSSDTPGRSATRGGAPSQAGPSSAAPAAPEAPGDVLLPPTRSVVSFLPGRKQLGLGEFGGITALARQVAAAGLREKQANLPARRITITGYGNGRWYTPLGVGEQDVTTGQERAQTVADVFRAELAYELDALQDAAEAAAARDASDAGSLAGSDGYAGSIAPGAAGRIGIDAFTITVASRGRALGAGGRTGYADARQQRQQAVIEISQPPGAAAVARLAALQKADPHMGDDFDPEALLYRTMKITVLDVPTASHHRALTMLADEATAAGKATSLAALRAFHLGQRGALDPDSRITAPGGKVMGRNWTGTPISDLDTTSFDVRSAAPTPRPALWHARPGDPEPYVVVADGDDDHVMVRLPDGSTELASREDFAELLAMDPELAALPAGTPVVLVWGNAGAGGLALPRAAATATGRTVWAHSGMAGVIEDPQTKRPRITVTDLTVINRPTGRWIASEPGYPVPDPRGRTRLLDEFGSDGDAVPDDEITSFTIVSGGRPIGRALFSDRDYSVREEFYETLPDHAESLYWDSVDAVAAGGSQPLPWAGQDPYFFYLHGLPGSLTMRRGKREAQASGEQAGGYLKRRPSLARLARQVPIVLGACWADTPADALPHVNAAGRPPFVADPLTTITAAQGVANATERTVFAANRVTYNRGTSGPDAAVMVATTALNEPGTWREVRPEPREDELDALAAVAGLLPATAGSGPGQGMPAEQAREAALRLVRALRQTFGVSVEDDKDDPAGTYRALLRGIAALDTMRRNDPELRDAGRLFTLDLLDRTTRSHLQQQGAGKPRPRALDPGDVRAMLAAADSRLSAAPGTALRDFAPLPSVDKALSLLRADLVDLVGKVLHEDESPLQEMGPDGVYGPTDTDRQRTVWATVKAVEALDSAADVGALADKVLHLGGVTGPPDDARRAELLWLAAAAAAAGTDPHHPSALAAYHLSRNGALAPATLLLSPSRRSAGRNWTTVPVKGEMSTDSYLRSPDGTVATAVERRAPWEPLGQAADQPPASYYVAVEASGSGHVAMPWPGGGTRTVPSDEIAELLLLDQHLSGRPVDTTVVLVGADSQELARAISARTATARTVTMSDRSTRLVHDPGKKTNAVLLTWVDSKSPAQDDWTKVRPGPPPQPAVAAPAPPTSPPAGPPVAPPIANSVTAVTRVRFSAPEAPEAAPSVTDTAESVVTTADRDDAGSGDPRADDVSSIGSDPDLADPPDKDDILPARAGSGSDRQAPPRVSGAAAPGGETIAGPSSATAATPATPAAPGIAPLPRPRSVVTFGPGAKQLTPTQLGEISALARQVAVASVREIGVDLPARRITVTGYGNGRWYTPLGVGERDARTGTQRAQAVADAFRAELAAELHELQNPPVAVDLDSDADVASDGGLGGIPGSVAGSVPGSFAGSPMGSDAGSVTGGDAAGLTGGDAVSDVASDSASDAGSAVDTAGDTGSDGDAESSAPSGPEQIGIDAFTITVESRGRALGADARLSYSEARLQRRQAVIEISQPPHAAAVARLAALRLADPDLADEFNRDSTVRRVMHVPEDEVTEAHYSELYTLVDEAMAAGRATSMAALSAYRLKKLGALSAAFRTTAPDGSTTGINWTPFPAGDVDTASYAVDTAPGTPRPAPWQRQAGGPRPFVVAAGGGHDHIRIGPWPAHPVFLPVPWEDFVELLSMDEELAALGSDVPVVMVVRGGAGAQGLDMPRAAATATGRTVWAHSGDTMIVEDPQTHRGGIVVTDKSASRRPTGEWIASEPGYPAPDPQGTIDSLSGARDQGIPDRELESFTLVRDGRPIGRSVFGDEDQFARTRLWEGLPDQTVSLRFDSVTETLLSGVDALPWAGKEAYYFSLHGLPGSFTMRRDHRKIEATGNEVGGFLKRRPSVRQLAAHIPIVLASCWADTPGDYDGEKPHLNTASRAPFIADPLRTVSAAQAVANVTRHTVFAPDRTHYAEHFTDKPSMHMIAATALNEPGVWRELRPEPLEEELDALALLAGLLAAAGPASGSEPGLPAAQAREAALRLVRALRRTFGVAVEDDKDDPAGTYQALLRGIGALEIMRRNDPELRDAGQFTLELLDRATRSHLRQHGTDKPQPAALEPADIRALLEAARARLSGAAGSPLRDFVPLPSLDEALALLDVDDLTVLARRVLPETRQERGPDGDWVMVDGDRQSLLWATVKAVEAVGGAADLAALADKVLHLGGAAGPMDAELRGRLVWLVAGAAAAGADPYHPSALAAHHLVQQGALSFTTQLSSPSGASVGRNWTGKPVQGRLQTSSYVRSTDGTIAAGTQIRGPWVSARATTGLSSPGYFVVVDPDGADHIDMALPGGRTQRVPFDEIAQLLLLDDDLNDLEAQTHVVLIGTANPALPRAVADRTAAARNVTMSAQPTRLVHDSGDGTYRVMLTQPSRGAARRTDWTAVRPGPPPGSAVPAPPALTPAPVLPVPRSGASPSAAEPEVRFGPPEPPTGTWFPAGTSSPAAEAPQDAVVGAAQDAAGPSGAAEDAAAEQAAILAGIYGAEITGHRIYPALRQAAARLDTLRRTEREPALSAGPLTLDVIDAATRRVLLLPADEPVTGEHRGELFRVAMDEAVEQAGSLAALAAFHLTLRGVFSTGRTLGGAADELRGMNWTGLDASGLDVTQVGVSVPGPDGRLALRGDPTTARWQRPGGPAPYTIVASGAHDHIEVRGFKGAVYQVPKDVFAELLALDPALAALPADVPVVLLVPRAGGGGLDLPRRAADRTGREIWSASGHVRMARQDPADPADPMRVSLVEAFGMRRGDWIASRPGQLLDPASAGDAPDWESEVLTQTIVSNGRPVGRSAFDDAEAPRMESYLQHLADMTELWHHNAATGNRTKDDRLVPWTGREVYFFAAHSLPGAMNLPLPGGRARTTRGQQIGGLLKRRPSLVDLPADGVIVMEACWFAAAADGDVTPGGGSRSPFVSDPLATVSDAQHVSNETARTVFGSTRPAGNWKTPGGFVHTLMTDLHGRRGRWLEYRPEPTGNGLDEAARAAGLHTGEGPASPAVRDRALRLVRALRLAFGAGVDQDGSYLDLLAGIGALDRML